MTELTPAGTARDIPRMAKPARPKSAIITEIRARLGISGEKFARLMGVSSGRQVRKWENDESGVPDSAIHLATLLDECPGAIDIVERVIAQRGSE